MIDFGVIDLDDVADAIATGADVVGLGESTRFAHETFAIRDQLFRRLVRDHGFRVLAVQDDASAAQSLDAFVTHGTGTAATALANAWRPWRTTEMVMSLYWIRAFNKDHPDDPVHVIGVKPAQVRPADYDVLLGYVPELAAHLEPIRTAHDMDEHVQKARGLHPGRPFAEHARAALAIVGRLPAGPTADEARELMRRIADYHERSVAGRGDYAGDAHTWAAAISDHQRRTGQRLVYWDGIAHTAASPVSLGLAPERGFQPTVGSVLRQEFGARYVSVALGFHHGDLGVAVVPEPDPDWLDARLYRAAPSSGWVDLRADELRDLWNGPAKARVISGVYEPSRDAAEHLAVASLPEAFDVLVQVREVSPVRGLAA